MFTAMLWEDAWRVLWIFKEQNRGETGREILIDWASLEGEGERDGACVLLVILLKQEKEKRMDGVSRLDV